MGLTHFLQPGGEDSSSKTVARNFIPGRKSLFLVMSAVREASWKSRGRGRGGRGSFSGNRDWSAGEGDYEDSATIHRRVLDEEGMADFVRYQQGLAFSVLFVPAILKNVSSMD